MPAANACDIQTCYCHNRGNNQIAQRTHIMENMKLKIKITGPKVHDVGYRYFLMSNAIDMGLKGFHARNRTGEKEPEVIALVEGDEEAIADFKVLVETQKPEHSKVSSIAFEDYDGDVMRAGEYAQVCSAQQLNKAIPLLLDMRDDLKAVRKNTDMIPQISEDIKAVRKNTDTIPQVLDEIKGLRDDIQPGYSTRFSQMQSDVRAIKERLGMH
jgi:acylphosphatase